MRGINFMYIIMTCLVIQVSHNEVVASVTGDKWRSAAKSLMSSSTALIPEPEAPKGLRNKVFYTSANMALDRGFNLLETAYPASKIATPVAKRIALPIIMKAHEKFGSRFYKDDNRPASDENSQVRPVEIKRSGSFRDKLKSWMDSDSNADRDKSASATSEKVPDTKEKQKQDGDNSEEDNKHDDAKSDGAKSATSDKISDLKTKLRSFMSRSDNGSKRFAIKQPPAPIANSHESEDHGSNKDATAQKAVHDEKTGIPKESAEEV